jgi:hypothetical protein
MLSSLDFRKDLKTFGEHLEAVRTGVKGRARECLVERTHPTNLLVSDWFV